MSGACRIGFLTSALYLLHFSSFLSLYYVGCVGNDVDFGPVMSYAARNLEQVLVERAENIYCHHVRLTSPQRVLGIDEQNDDLEW
jgi:hypothetical protein